MPHPHTTLLLFFKKNLCVFPTSRLKFQRNSMATWYTNPRSIYFSPQWFIFQAFCFWTQRHSVFFLLPFFEDCTSEVRSRFQIDIRKQKYSMILTALDQLARVKLRPRLIWVTTSPFTWMFGMMLGAYSFEYEQWCLLYMYGFQQKSFWFRFHWFTRSNKISFWTLFLKKNGWKLAFYLRLTHFEVVQCWQRAAFECISTNPAFYFCMIGFEEKIEKYFNWVKRAFSHVRSSIKSLH